MKASTPLLLTLFVLVLSSCLSAWARDYYVSPYGTDDNPGTPDNPFNTIQRAADVARAGDTIYVRVGLYRETVRPAHSGSAGKPITITAFPGEGVVLSAGDPVTGWRRHQGDIWKAKVDWDMGRDGVGNTLFVNDVLKFEAREGAETDPILMGDWKRVPPGQMKSEGLTSPDLKGWGDDFWNGAKVRHHNIVHDLTPVTARIGQLQFLKYYHNTWIGPAPTGNVNAASFAYESSYSNNLQLTLGNGSSLGVETRGNDNYRPADFADLRSSDFRLAAGSRAHISCATVGPMRTGIAPPP